MHKILLGEQHHVLTCSIATNFASRAGGLLFGVPLEPQHGLLIPCRAIHTVGMRFPIDAIYLKQSEHTAFRYTVVHLCPYLKPWRFSIFPGIRPTLFSNNQLARKWFVLEVRAGEIKRLKITTGQIATFLTEV